MDGDSVTEEPSKQYTTLSEVFMAMCPYYMGIGMSYHDYWHMNTSAHKAYREAYEIRMKNDEWARHRQGLYFMQALAVALQGFSKSHECKEKYPDEPWPITQKEADERQLQREKAGYELALAQRRAAIEAAKLRSLDKKEANMGGSDD